MISAAIMNHPSRSLSSWLLRRLADVDTKVICRPDLDLWACAREAWWGYQPAATHHLVLHDDMLLCENFVLQLQAVIKQKPKAPLCLWSSFCPDIPEGTFEAYANFAWGGGLCLPTHLIPEFLAFTDWIEPRWKMDDTRFALWCAATGRRVHVPYPNLIQHDHLPSIAREGKPNQTSHTFREFLGLVDWSPVVRYHPGDPRAFVISRGFHFLKGNPYV